jgi:hypothetical protein
MEHASIPWRLAVTTPSLPGIWGAVRKGLGLSARTTHRLPSQIIDIGRAWGLPRLPSIEVRLFAATDLSPAALLLRDILAETLQEQLKEEQFKAASRASK